MKVLIIEDEKPAAEKLILLLKKYDPQIEIFGPITSIEKSVTYLQSNSDSIELIFQDIQLTDGLSFEIFKELKINTPIIFTTAFNEHAIEAFKVNSIDYLLKPIAFEDLSNSIDKYKNLAIHLPGSAYGEKQFEDLLNSLSDSKKTYKSRFLIKIGEHLKSVASENIALIYAEGRTVFVFTDANRKFIIDFKLEDLSSILDPELFFRVSRTYIVNFKQIKDVIVYSNSRLKIRLSVNFENDIIVSREKVKLFKDWFSG